MAKKLIHGVGEYVVGGYVAYADGKNTREYRLWYNMLQRCYSAKFHEKCPTYVECSVSEDFKDFQKFASWANAQPGYGSEGAQLDKDLLVSDNKVYGSETCVFLPRCINTLLTSSGASRGKWPVGVHAYKDRYLAQVSAGRKIHLGLFPTPEAAFAVYKQAKEAVIKQCAEGCKDQLDSRAYDALMAYEILITD